MVSEKVAREFAMSDLFSELLAVEGARSPHFIKALCRDSVIPTAPELSDLDDELAPGAEEDAGVDAILGCGVDETQLLEEQRAWCPTVEWTTQAHQLMLDDNLAFLTSVDVKPWVSREKGYVLQWIFTVDDIGGRDVRTIPFSFHNCCLASGLKPDDLRAELLQLDLVRKLLVNLRLCNPCDLPPRKSKVYYADIVGVDSPEIPDHPVYQFGW